MWIFTKDAFLSAVQHRDLPDSIMVRARRREHLEAFIAKCSTGKIIETPDADYRFRVTMSAELFAGLLVIEAAVIDYDNYKNAITDPELARCAHDVWGDMLPLQRGAT